MFSCFVVVQERLAQEESTVVALRQESGSKEEQLNKLRNTLKLVTLTSSAHFEIFVAQSKNTALVFRSAAKTRIC